MSASMDGDDASSFSSDGEQVIEITSHSRILISPRKVRGSAWDEKPPGPRNTRAKAVGKTRTPPTSERKSREVSKGRNATRRGLSNQKRKAEKPRKSESSLPAPFPKETTRKQTNNDDDVSDSDFDSEDAESTTRDRMSHRSDEESCGSEASIENASPKNPAPKARRIHRSRGQEATGDSSVYLASSLEDSMQSLVAPTTPGEEMEELKATLKKLARHEEDDSRRPLLSTKASEISSASALREYLTVANATAAEQLRPGEYTRLKTRHASFQPPRSTSNQQLRVKAKSMREPGSENRTRRDDPLAKLPGRNSETANEHFSLHKKLFSTPPPPAGGSAGGPGLPFGGGGPTGGSGANGSRAVLSALKALQDKINRLEEEREALRQQLSDTKLVARKREAELAATEKRFTYELGQMKEAARAAYDSLRGDRDELKLQLVKSEERRKAARTELQHFQELAKTVSAKADDLQTQLQGSETHRTRLQTGTWSNVKPQAAVALSQLNEKLVAKVWEAMEAANQATKRHRKLQQQQRPSTLLRPTAASRASAAAVSDAASRRVAATGSQSSFDASPARNPKKKKPSLAGKSSISTKKLKKPKSSNNMTLLREANLGK
ncbi:hypothetical protein BBJ28_00006380 [Nothophytophthora sp. Chile5]|nr:hypothetical protein BBJ28_00006380 [Nothophytophthora sp. Chile5]